MISSRLFVLKYIIAYSAGHLSAYSLLSASEQAGYTPCFRIKFCRNNPFQSVVNEGKTLYSPGLVRST
jgi:hypothetical protein